MAKEQSEPKYIDISPPGKDLFAGKSQEKIAESIAELIKNNSMQGKLIGLDGVWGSGKSNLIKILEGLLKKTHHVFTYDAWSYQEDLQRRSFLEGLTENLSKNKIIKSSDWNSKLKNLLARKRETNTRTIPRLSLAVITLALVTFLTPIFKQISDAFDNPSATTSGETTSNSIVYLKILVTSLPLLLAIAIWIIVLLQKKKLSKITDLLYLYKGKEIEETTHVTISEKEPSIREFQKWMSDLSEDLEKDLIVVFDNMDRLPPDKVKRLWSSIHTFFSENQFKKIWSVVTFDREHLKAAFGDNCEVSNQFINKTFSVIFIVPPPVLTDWQRFFDIKFKEAFSDFKNSEREVVKRIFDSHYDHITPRAIIAFINELVSIKSIVKDEIKLRYIAVFVSTKKEILENPVNKILNLSFLKTDKALFSSDKNLQDSIAALVYNVPLTSASQVTLTREIETSIRDQDGEKLNELTQHIHFLDIVEQVLRRGTADIENAPIILDQLDKDFSEEDSVKNRLASLWNILGEHFKQISIGEQELNIAHQALIKNLSGDTLDSFLTYWIDGICNFDKFDGVKYYDAITSLSKYLKKNSINFDVFSKLNRRRVSPEVFLEFLRKAQRNYKKYKLVCEESELNDFISEKLPDKLEDYSALTYTKKEYDFSSVIDKIENVIPSITNSNCSNVYALYKTIAPEKPIKPIPNDNLTHELLQTAKKDSEGYYDLIAMRLAKGRSWGDRGGISQVIVNQNDDQLVKNIAERIKFFICYGDILLEAKDWNSSLLRSVAKEVTINPYGTSRMTIEKVLPCFKDIYKAIAVEPEQLINKLDGWSHYVKDTINSDNITDIIQDVEFFEYAIEVECELSNLIIKVFIEYLESVTEDEWISTFKDENSYLFNSTYWLLKGNKIKKLPENAFFAYKSNLKDIANSKTGVPSQKNNVIYEKTNKNSLKSTLKDIRDIFIINVDISPELFVFFFDMLLDHGKLAKRADDVTRRILTPVIDDKDCLALILEDGKRIAEIINKSGDDSVDFKDKIRQKTELSDDKVLLDFAEKIGIKI